MTTFARLVNWKIVKRLDNWKVWMLIAYIGLAAFGVALWHTQNKTTRVIAERRADIVANADAQYTQCEKSIPTLTKINRFLDGVRVEHATLLKNAILSHEATPQGTALYETQKGNIVRLRKALDEVRDVEFPVPTLKQCRELRAKLSVKK